MGKVKAQVTNCTMCLEIKELRLDQENEVLWEGVLQKEGKEEIHIVSGLFDYWKNNTNNGAFERKLRIDI